MTVPVNFRMRRFAIIRSSLSICPDTTLRLSGIGYEYVRMIKNNFFLSYTFRYSYTYISKDYWNLPNGQRAELIDGQFYNMAPPSRIYQEISYQISRLLENYIESNGGKCRVYPPRFAVNLDADDKDWVEPDISLICDPNKLTDRGCSGAPDLIFEIVSHPAGAWTTLSKML